MQSAREHFDYLNHAYVAVHKAKEDLFWATYMATSDDQAGFVRAEGAYKEFIGDPAIVAQSRDLILPSQFTDRFHIINKAVLSYQTNMKRQQDVAGDKIIIINILLA